MIKTACVFPGQGSQSVGMLSDFISKYASVRSLFEEAAELLEYDLLNLVLQGPEAQLNQTEHTQVAMLTADVAIFNVLLQEGLPLPSLMAGHSLGEYPALVAAKALTFADALILVRERARLMQEAVPMGQGAMAAIVGLSDEQVLALCTEASTDNELVAAANFNAIGQVVVAGHTPAVERLIELALGLDARLAKLIPVSVPCHCPLLREAAALFAESLKKTPFSIPNIEVISNVDLKSYQTVEQIRAGLQTQLYSPVQWVGTIELFKHRGVDRILEVGPAKVLTGLIKRIDKNMNTISICDTMSLSQLDLGTHVYSG